MSGLESPGTLLQSNIARHPTGIQTNATSFRICSCNARGRFRSSRIAFFACLWAVKIQAHVIVISARSAKTTALTISDSETGTDPFQENSVIAPFRMAIARRLINPAWKTRYGLAGCAADRRANASRQVKQQATTAASNSTALNKEKATVPPRKGWQDSTDVRFFPVSSVFHPQLPVFLLLHESRNTLRRYLLVTKGRT